MGTAGASESKTLDLIDRIGPGGEYMSTEETAQRCRNDMIKSRLKKIIHEHNTIPIPDGADEKIATILSSAAARESR